MLNETFIRRLNNIVISSTTKEEITEKVVYLTNDLKNDIAEAIKKNAQSGGGVDFIDVPKAIDIVAKGGTPTNRERLELARECMEEGDMAEAIRITDEILNND